MNNGREDTSAEYQPRGLDSSTAHPPKVMPGQNENEARIPQVGIVREGLGIVYDVEQLKKKGHEGHNTPHLLQVDFRISSHTRLPDQIYDPFLPFIPR